MPKKITQNVNKDKFFNDLPEVHPQMSKWLQRHTNYQSCNASEIVPIYYEEILPNEEKKLTLGMISHTTTPIAPIFNALYTEIRTFFVPTRLAADLLNGYSTRKSPWVKVFGEDNKSTNASVIVPLVQQKLPDVSTSFINSVRNYLGNVSSKNNVLDSLDLSLKNQTNIVLTDFNFLQLASYELIYQRHYRNENYEASTSSSLYRLLFNAYNSSNVPSLSNSFTFEKANREKDYFTGAKPFTLKNTSPVTIGLTGSARVDNASVQPFSPSWVNASGTKIGGELQAEATGITASAGSPASGSSTAYLQLAADLSTASGISIEELRILIKTQELLEKDAIYGSLYAESLNAHFGTCPLDLTLQDPAELYRTTITSNMQAIFQTSSTSGEASILGTIGANSTTQTEPFVILPKTKFHEHGILMVCAVHKLQNVYDAKYFKPKFIFKKARFDFYTPELNDLGYQPVSNKEADISNNPILGYNEAFAEYRFSFNKSHGELNDQFPYWAPAIADEYGNISSMYKEDTIILDKALSIAHTIAPQFYDAWGFEEECTKPMSLHSIPGMDGVI